MAELSGTEICGIWTFLVLYIIGVGLFGGAFQTLAPLKMGIAKNTVLSRIDTTRVYFNGRYFLGLGMTFIEYPTNAISLATSVTAATKDKQQVTMSIFCQYQLNPDNLIQLYQTRGNAYTSYYQKNVVQAVQEEAVNWQTNPDYYHNRVEIANGIRARVVVYFAQNFATLVDFRVLEIDLPDPTEQKIIDTITAQQQNTLTTYQQQASVTRKQATNQLQIAQAQVQVINATATANATFMVAQATATAFEIQVNATAESMAILADKMSFSPQQLVKYLWYDTIVSESTSQVLVGLSGVLKDTLASNMVISADGTVTH